MSSRAVTTLAGVVVATAGVLLFAPPLVAFAAVIAGDLAWCIWLEHHP